MITISKEDYLKAIYEADAEGERVIAATLANWMKVSAPAVTMALRRLKRDGLVETDREGIIRLTTSGREIARRTLTRHHLIERMLHEIFGMEWWKIHDEAERLEHAVSAEFEQKLWEKLGKGDVCPHGNSPVPQTPAARRKKGLSLLSEAEPGYAYAVASVYERDRKLLEFLEEKGLRPGAKLDLHARNYDQTLTLSTADGRFSLGAPVAEKVWVQPAKRR